MDTDAVLAEQERQLMADLATLTAAPPEGENLSFGKRVGDGTALAVDRLSAVAVQEQLLDSLAQVRAARRRVDDGTYGRCEVCGEEIPAGRLEARPWATRCVQHV